MGKKRYTKPEIIVDSYILTVRAWTTETSTSVAVNNNATSTSAVVQEAATSTSVSYQEALVSTSVAAQSLASTNSSVVTQSVTTLIYG